MYDINTNRQTARQIDSRMAVDETFSYGELKMMKEILCPARQQM